MNQLAIASGYQILWLYTFYIIPQPVRTKKVNKNRKERLKKETPFDALFLANATPIFIFISPPLSRTLVPFFLPLRLERPQRVHFPTLAQGALASFGKVLGSPLVILLAVLPPQRNKAYF